MQKGLVKKDILYPGESYKIIGSAFDVYNTLGSGHHEKYYQKALAEAFRLNHLSFKEQVPCMLQYKGISVGKVFLDFLVESKIVVEIKKGNSFSKRHIDQVLGYLKISTLKLAILINFGNEGVLSKRIVNFN